MALLVVRRNTTTILSVNSRCVSVSMWTCKRPISIIDFIHDVLLKKPNCILLGYYALPMYCVYIISLKLVCALKINVQIALECAVKIFNYSIETLVITNRKEKNKRTASPSRRRRTIIYGFRSRRSIILGRLKHSHNDIQS